MDGVSIVITTKDRVELLKINLSTLDLVMDGSTLQFEIIVMNDGSTDDTAKELRAWQQSGPNRYTYQVASRGASANRNQGALFAKYDWICFLDDDLFVDGTFAYELRRSIQKSKFDLIGGCYDAWYYYPKPPWLPEGFGSNRYPEASDLVPLGQESLHAGILLIRKQVLLDVGGFNCRLGPKKGKMKYGEENELRVKAEYGGYSIGINSKLIVNHLVDRRKYSVLWQVVAEFQRKRDKYHSTPYPIGTLPKKMLSVLVRFFQFFFLSAWKYISRKDYYLQNAVLDWLMPIARQCGKIYSIVIYGILNKDLDS